MKKSYNISVIILLLSFLFVSCDEYLDKTPEAGLSDTDIFTSYNSFQGYADQMYAFLVEPNGSTLIQGSENFDQTLSGLPWSSAGKFELGQYWSLIKAGNSNYWSTKDRHNVFGVNNGYWPMGWAGIRAANMILEKMPMLVNATDEEKELLLGQAYFFRAFFHWEICKRWGGLPYVDHVYEPTEDMHIPRLTFQETVDRIAEDFDKAVQYLPDDWDNTTVGGQNKGYNAGRATKGAALAFKAKALLFAGSPLMNHETTGSYTFNKDYMQRAAEAAWEVIKLADKGVYSLLPFEEIQRNFAVADATMPWTKETIFQKVNTKKGFSIFKTGIGRIYYPPRLGGNNNVESPTQNLIDMFEMDNGLPINDPASGYNELDPWSNRDPRFYEFILHDQQKAGFDKRTACQFYEGGSDQKNPLIRTAYFVRKYMPPGVNKYDKKWDGFRYVTPFMRLAEVYLIYAEAVNEAFGPNGTITGSSLTAAKSLNIVRNRSEMPDIDPEFTGSTEAFRKRIWNERSVELCFEGQRWNDIRRWHVAHLPENKVIYDLEFDKAHTYFNRVVRATMVFEERHYWLPFPKEQTEIYVGWSQNPGW